MAQTNSSNTVIGTNSISFVASTSGIIPKAQRKLISWNPYFPSNFIVASSDLRLYELKIKKGGKSSSAFLQFSIDEQNHCKRIFLFFF